MQLVKRFKKLCKHETDGYCNDAINMMYRKCSISIKAITYNMSKKVTCVTLLMSIRLGCLNRKSYPKLN